ncbi:hypothetical protein ALC57_12601 [Trachymyrmex cornetzi]|uniref:Uncharacterized protein n=1 Tax=Trachymyrmex cornetzi TaxID=471704 RepID=A0A151J0V1_9HYME|nr:hypothetical protein ALC57_12601 [Trachymyrmex cornetzi]
MLCEEFTAAGIPIKRADNDADVVIIETAIKQFKRPNTTVVVGEDVDLLILLTARTPIDKIIYFLKPGKAQVQSTIYSSQSLTAYPKCQTHILFLHAITGCDTTSAIFKREVFTKIDSSPHDIVTNGIRFLLAMYGAPKKIDSIDKYRYLRFVKSAWNKKTVQLSSLPPTSASAFQHLYRVYYQVQVWLGNELDPEEWGWKLIDNCLDPIQTLLPPAPEKLLNTIFCNCKTDCSKTKCIINNGQFGVNARYLLRKLSYIYNKYY